MKMNTKFLNLENSKTSKSPVLVLKLTNKVDLKIGEKVIAYQIVVFITHGET